jgi:hypothetical protein
VGNTTHGEGRLVVEDLLDARDDLGCELGVDLESLEVLDDLLGLGGSELSGSVGHTDTNRSESLRRSCSAGLRGDREGRECSSQKSMASRDSQYRSRRWC